jgi:hypothetical protein
VYYQEWNQKPELFLPKLFDGVPQAVTHLRETAAHSLGVAHGEKRQRGDFLAGGFVVLAVPD